MIKRGKRACSANSRDKRHSKRDATGGGGMGAVESGRGVKEGVDISLVGEDFCTCTFDTAAQ